MGAWIEISIVSKVPKVIFCRTLYGCVDWNLDVFLLDFLGLLVAPFMGAWIEILDSNKANKTEIRRTLYGCVDWNAINHSQAKISISSHPLWVRGLKLNTGKISLKKPLKSHPLWVRGLKYTQCREAKGKATCRILYGCVNWNKSLKYKWCF